MDQRLLPARKPRLARNAHWQTSVSTSLCSWRRFTGDVCGRGGLWVRCGGDGGGGVGMAAVWVVEVEMMAVASVKLVWRWQWQWGEGDSRFC